MEVNELQIRSQLVQTLLGFALVFLLVCAPVGAANVKLEFSGWSDNLIGAIIERFNREHPNIEIENVPGNDSQVLVRMVAGTGPDIYHVSWANFGSFVQNGLALDITELFDRDREEIQPEDIFPPALNAFQYGDKLFAMPHHLGGNLMYLNLDRFNIAGIPEPSWNWTWNDLAVMAGKLTLDTNGDGTVDVWGLANPSAWMFWASVIHSNGGKVYDKEEYKFYIDTDITRAAMRYLYDLANVFKGAPGPGIRPNGLRVWQAGTTGMVMAPATDDWQQVGYNFAVLPNPQGSAGTAMMGSAQPLAINPNCAHIEEAWTFLKWINRPDIQVWITNELQLFPPTRRSVVRTIKNPYMIVFGQQLENQVAYTDRMHNVIPSVFNLYMDKAIRNEMSIPEAAMNIQHELTVKLEEDLKK
jgi:ABC-type glycerol-3-phosphate transport system substrate-binding protein